MFTYDYQGTLHSSVHLVPPAIITITFPHVRTSCHLNLCNVCSTLRYFITHSLTKPAALNGSPVPVHYIYKVHILNSDSQDKLIDIHVCSTNRPGYKFSRINSTLQLFYFLYVSILFLTEVNF